MLWNLTCHTDTCENNNFTVQFPDPEPLVICGGCHQEITDKTTAES
jgi:hypothetical protein